VTQFFHSGRLPFAVPERSFIADESPGTEDQANRLLLLVRDQVPVAADHFFGLVTDPGVG